jgi:hypothetical protein
MSLWKNLKAIENNKVMHYTQKYLLDKIKDMEWQHTKLMMPLIKRIIVAEHAVKRVREIHSNENGFCAECSQYFPFEYPCETIKALDGE